MKRPKDTAKKTQTAVKCKGKVTLAHIFVLMFTTITNFVGYMHLLGMVNTCTFPN